MSGIFFGCISLSSIPDISKWNIDNAKDMSFIFTKCTSLISLPDISKWNPKNLKYLVSMFSDCLSLLNLPDLTKWNNYDEHMINETPDYNFIDKFNNFEYEFSIDDPDEAYKAMNDYEYLAKKKLDKFTKIYNEEYQMVP